MMKHWYKRRNVLYCCITGLCLSIGMISCFGKEQKFIVSEEGCQNIPEHLYYDRMLDCIIADSHTNVLRTLKSTNASTVLNGSNTKEREKFTDEEIEAYVRKHHKSYNLKVHESYPAYTFQYPVVWGDSPFSNNSWELYFQSFHWMKQLLNKEKVDQIFIGKAISDWVQTHMDKKDKLAYTWYNHAIAMRLDFLISYLQYLDKYASWYNKQIFDDCNKAALGMVYALASKRFYPKLVPYNHGMMMDISLLKNIVHLDFSDKQKLIKHGFSRLNKQIKSAVTSDGMHIENSPSYHQNMVAWLSQSIKAVEKLGIQVPERWKQDRQKLVYNMMYMVQPNMTFAQFGNSTNAVINLNKHIQWIQGTVEQQKYDEFLYVASSGKQGKPPKQLDQVFPESGYVMLRERWGKKDDFSAPITIYQTNAHLSHVHYNADETSFSLYGYGKEIIVDAGLYNHKRSDPFHKYQYAAFAHNILIADNTNFDTSRDVLGDSGISDFALSDNVSWVKSYHTHYKSIGIEKIERTLIYIRPATCIVVDVPYATSPHSYTQHFHFHPDFAVIDTKEASIILQDTKNKRVQVRIETPNKKAGITVARGVQEHQKVQGWYFPKFNTKQAAADVMVSYPDNLVSKPLVSIIRIIHGDHKSDNDAITVDVSQKKVRKGQTIYSYR